MLLRQATADDNAALLTLEATSLPVGVSTRLRSDFFGRGSLYAKAVHMVAVQDGQIIGVQSGALKRMRLAGRTVTTGFLFNLRVHPDYRRQRIGDRLKAAVEDYLAAAGAGCIYCYIHSSNAANRSLLKKRGYEHTASMVLNVLQCDDVFEGEDLIRFGDVAELPEIVEACNSFYEKHDGVPDDRLRELYRNGSCLYAGSVIARSGDSRAWGSIWAGEGNPRGAMTLMFDVGCDGGRGHHLFAKVIRKVLKARPTLQIVLSVDSKDEAILQLIGQHANRTHEEFVMMKWLTRAPATTYARPFYFDVRD